MGFTENWFKKLNRLAKRVEIVKSSIEYSQPQISLKPTHADT
jgi:hypothetical protein